MAQKKWVAERFNKNKIQQLHQFPPSSLKSVSSKLTSQAKKNVNQVEILTEAHFFFKKELKKL